MVIAVIFRCRSALLCLLKHEVEVPVDVFGVGVQLTELDVNRLKNGGEFLLGILLGMDASYRGKDASDRHDEVPMVAVHTVQDGALASDHREHGHGIDL